MKIYCKHCKEVKSFSKNACVSCGNKSEELIALKRTSSGITAGLITLVCILSRDVLREQSKVIRVWCCTIVYWFMYIVIVNILIQFYNLYNKKRTLDE